MLKLREHNPKKTWDKQNEIGLVLGVWYAVETEGGGIGFVDKKPRESVFVLQGSKNSWYLVVGQGGGHDQDGAPLLEGDRIVELKKNIRIYHSENEETVVGKILFTVVSFDS